MPKLILLKKPKNGVSRGELIDYLKNVHGPRNSQLPGLTDYTLMVQVDPDKHENVPDDIEYYDSSKTLPVEINATPYDTVEIHEFETMENLLRGHSSEQGEEAESELGEIIDFDEEITIVVEDEEIKNKPAR